MTDVSIVIPTRDRPEFLSQALQSARAQQGASIEVLVVDDGTSDRAMQTIGRLNDARVRLLRNDGPAGVSGARNTGIAAAIGEWVAFLDDDDVWAPGKLAAQLSAGRQSGAGWVYGGDVTVDEALRVYAGEPPPSPEVVLDALRQYNSVPAGASNVVVRRGVLERAGTFDTDLRTSEDWDLWLRLARIGPPACVARPLVAVRTHAGMASRGHARMLADIEVVARRHGINVDRARHRRWAAWMCLEDGRRGEAFAHYVGAVAAGDLLSVGRAAMTVAYPRMARRNDRSRSVELTAWLQEAEAWLAGLRPGVTA